MFSTAITGATHETTYQWLRNNKELLNVATSRAKDKLIVLGSLENLHRLHQRNEEDDLYELVEYVRTNGRSEVTPKSAASRALGVKPFSTATEEAFAEYAIMHWKTSGFLTIVSWWRKRWASPMYFRTIPHAATCSIPAGSILWSTKKLMRITSCQFWSLNWTDGAFRG